MHYSYTSMRIVNICETLQISMTPLQSRPLGSVGVPAGSVLNFVTVCTYVPYGRLHCTVCRQYTSTFPRCLGYRWLRHVIRARQTVAETDGAVGSLRHVQGLGAGSPTQHRQLVLGRAGALLAASTCACAAPNLVHKTSLVPTSRPAKFHHTLRFYRRA